MLRLSRASRYCALPLIVGTILAALWVTIGMATGATVSPPAAYNVLYVAPDADCGGASPCYPTLQEAIDAARDGDTIQVAAGLYTDTHRRLAPPGYSGPAVITQVACISKTIAIHGGYPPDNWSAPNPISYPTTLDAQGRGRVIFIAGNISPTLRGLRITGGDATGLGGHADSTGYVDSGGGMYISAAAALSNTWISNNHASLGGGIYLNDSDNAGLIGNTVISNTAYVGGGLYLHSCGATLQGNTVNANTATGDGGGIKLYYSPAILRGNIRLYRE